MASTDVRVNTTSTDATTASNSLGDWLIVFPYTTAAGGLNAAAGRGILYGIDGMNTTGTEKFLFVFDFASVAGSIPANGTLPITGAKLKHCLDIPPNTTNKGQFGYLGTAGGESFGNGLVLVVSTTPPGTLTVDTAKTTFISCSYGTSYPGWS